MQRAGRDVRRHGRSEGALMNRDEVSNKVGQVIGATDIAMHQRRLIASLQAIADCVQAVEPDASNRTGVMLAAPVGAIAQLYGVDVVREVLAGIVANDEFWNFQRNVAADIAKIKGARR
jgi:hypothetical protein